MNENNQAPETISVLAAEYIASSVGVKAVQSARLYRYTVDRFNEYLGREATLADFNDKTVTAFIRSRGAAGMKPATCEREGNKLLCLWRWAARKGWCEYPIMRITKTSPGTPTAWSREELDELFHAAEAYPAHLFELPAGLYFTALLRLIWDTGERIGAIGELKWADVDLRLRWIIFRKETRKGRGKTRDNVQKLSRRTVRALEAFRPFSVNHETNQGRERIRVWLTEMGKNKGSIRLRYRDPMTNRIASIYSGTKDREEAERRAYELTVRLRALYQEAIAAKSPPSENELYVFPGAQRQAGSAPWELYYHLKKILKAAGLPSDSRSMFHRLRRTHATHLYVAGGDPTQSLGHYNDQMTRDYYLDPRFTQQDHASDLLNGGIAQPIRRLLRRMKRAFGR